MLKKCLFRSVIIFCLFAACSTDQSQNSESYTFPVTAELIEIGAINSAGEMLLARPGFVLPLQSGEFIVGDTQTLSLHLYKKNLEYVNSLGGSGDGPGEFRRFSDMSVNQSTATVYDGRRSIISEFTIQNNSLSLVNTSAFTYTSHPDHPGAMFWRFANGHNGDHTALYYDFNITSQDELFYHKIIAFPYTSDYKPGTENPARVFEYSPELKNDNIVLSVPFLRRGLIASLNGNIVYAQTDTPEILIYNRSGELIQTIDLPDTTVKLAREEKTEAYNRLYANSPDPERFRNEVFAYIPDQRPVIRSLQTDADKRIWVRIYRDGSEQDWILFNSDGSPIMQTALPHGHSFRNASGNRVFTQRTTENGPEIVILEWED